MSQSTYIYADPSPYPKIEVSEPNLIYGMSIVSNIGDSNSEMSAISLYVYNNLVTKDAYAEVSEVFTKISMVEMRHLHIFGEMALKLGVDPRLWSFRGRRPVYWSPASNQYLSELVPLLRNSINSEQDAIRKYQKQIALIEDPLVKAILERVILDEMNHAEIFHNLLNNYGNNKK